MAKRKSWYFIINKPYGVLSQFSDEDGHPGLGSIYDLPKDVYPVGRLDRDSEGLLILTNDKSLNNSLLNPLKKHERRYWVEVEGVPEGSVQRKLESGVEINLKGKRHLTQPCKAALIEVDIPEREPPINRVKHPQTSWLEMKLTEGKNRQVRRMTAKVGHPTLRLIRVAIENVTLGKLESGGIIQISKNALYKKLKLPI